MSGQEHALRPERILLLDELRGFALFCMLLHHGAFTFCLFGLDLRFFSFDLLSHLDSVWFRWLQLPFVLAFLLISGICCNLSHNNIRRGLIAFGLALGVTLVTWLFGLPAWFGILHLLGVSMLLYGLTKKWMDKAPFFLFFLLLFLALLLYELPYGALGLPGLTVCSLPDSLYQNDLFAFLGFPSKSFSSSDYYPILPWILPFFAGGLLGKKLCDTGWPAGFYKRRVPFFGFLGRHGLLIYLLHQPVFYGIFFLISRFV